jgi:hypothetical protein
MKTLKICAPGKLSQNVVRVVKIICKPICEEVAPVFASQLNTGGWFLSSPTAQFRDT